MSATDTTLVWDGLDTTLQTARIPAGEFVCHALLRLTANRGWRGELSLVAGTVSKRVYRSQGYPLEYARDDLARRARLLAAALGEGLPENQS